MNFKEYIDKLEEQGIFNSITNFLRPKQNTSGPQNGGVRTIQALPGDNLNDKLKEAEDLSQKTQSTVTLLFNNMRIVYINGQLRHDLSKLK